jgi:peptide subunit release factor 1 (eRF1)
VVRLAQPVESRIVLDDSPFVEPLVTAADPDHWCVLLTTRRDARVFHGTAESFDELERFSGAQGEETEDRAAQHTTDRAAEQHLRAVGEHLSRLLKSRPFDCLLIGASDALAGQVEAALHPYVRERLCGRIHVDVENASADQVREAAAPLIEEHAREAERSALDRFVQEIGRGGRAAAGLGAVLGALNEHRVELLLLQEGFRAGGAIETTSGMLTVDGGDVPVDEPQFEGRDDIVESAIERAVEQSADVLVIRRHDDLEAHGGIGAVLRF